MTVSSRLHRTPSSPLPTILALVVLVGAGCRQATSGGEAEECEETAQRRVLIVTGEDYPGHLWRETTPVLAELLRVDERWSVDVAESLDVLCEPRLYAYDALVMHFKNYDPQVPGRVGFEALRRFVKKGGGLVLVHFACGAFQEFAEEFETFAGRVWDPALRGHDPYGAFAVEYVDGEHPITRGLDAFEAKDELYTCLAGTTSIHVLAHARSAVDGAWYPMAFVLEHGKGRIFHTPLGHDVAAFRTRGTAELVRRGTAWAARLPVVHAEQISAHATRAASTGE